MKRKLRSSSSLKLALSTAPSARVTAGLKANFALVAGHGPDEVAQYFYSYLFLRYPETREMFPPAMTRQRDRLVGALVRIVARRWLVPDVERISARFHARREQKSGFERAVSRLIGMDLKLEQYKKGRAGIL